MGRRRTLADPLDPGSPEAQLLSPDERKRNALLFYARTKAVERMRERRASEPEIAEKYRAAHKRYRATERGQRTEVNKHLMRNYGVTLDWYHAKLAEQGGVCAICGGGPGTFKGKPRKHLCVDHCHSTGVVRGLLCHMCNSALGLLRDDVSILLKCVSYIGGKR